MHNHGLRGHAAFACASAVWVLSFTGCGGVIQFEGQTPIQIASPAPPPPEPVAVTKRVEVQTDRIQINEKILFELDKAEILPASHDLLNEIVGVLQEHPHIKKVDIVGHTDDYGTEQYNQSLSERRAKAVMTYLVSQGVSQERLSSKGLGESQPIADNSSWAEKEKNRRVEFLIIEQEGVIQ